MKPFVLLSLIAASPGLSSCSLVDRYGTSRPNLTLVSEQYTTYEGRPFVMRRFVVNRDSYETFVETVQLPPGIGGYPPTYVVGYPPP